MRQIPRPALLLGLAGVLPFAACVLALLASDLLLVQTAARWGLALYGLTILSFMSGCIWAFAAREGDPVGYGLSTLPALAGAFSFALPMAMGRLPTPVLPLWPMAGCFVLLLALDWRAARLGQTPPWWMPLRVLLTSLVVTCLVIGALV